MIFVKNLKKQPSIVHGFLEKSEAKIKGENVSDKVISKLLERVREAGFEKAARDNLIFARQFHTSRIYVCGEKDKGIISEKADGLISRWPGQVLIVKTADCLPILFYDPTKKQVGAVHAGKKGLLKGILKEAIRGFNTSPSSLVVGIGPHIRKCCYFLRSEKEAEKIACTRFKNYLKRKKKKFYFDLTQIAIDELISLGVKKENIQDTRICTYCDPEQRFFSARRANDLHQPHFCFFSFIGLIS